MVVVVRHYCSCNSWMLVTVENNVRWLLGRLGDMVVVMVSVAVLLVVVGRIEVTVVFNVWISVLWHCAYYMIVFYHFIVPLMSVRWLSFKFNRSNSNADRVLLRSKQLLAEEGNQGEAEHEIITRKGYICAANNYRQKKAACSEPTSITLCEDIPSDLSYHRTGSSFSLDGLSKVWTFSPDNLGTGLWPCNFPPTGFSTRQTVTDASV